MLTTPDTYPAPQPPSHRKKGKRNKEKDDEDEEHYKLQYTVVHVSTPKQSILNIQNMHTSHYEHKHIVNISPHENHEK